MTNIVRLNVSSVVRDNVVEPYAIVPRREKRRVLM
jgi:hypothetical protein